MAAEEDRDHIGRTVVCKSCMYMMCMDMYVYVNVKVYVYDVDNQVSKTIKVLQKPELTKMDLIIGPFYKRNFKLVSHFAKMFDIKIVNPLSRRNEILTHDNLIKVKP